MPQRYGARPMARCTLRRLLAAVVLSLALPGTASAATDALTNPTDQWLPRPDGATWDWAWSDSDYQPKATHEHYTVAARNGAVVPAELEETDAATGDHAGRRQHGLRADRRRAGQHNYQSTPPPPQFPILCASARQLRQQPRRRRTTC